MKTQDLAHELAEAALEPLNHYAALTATREGTSKHHSELHSNMFDLAHSVYGIFKSSYAEDIITFQPLARELLSRAHLVNQQPCLFSPQELYCRQRILDVIHQHTKLELFRFHVINTVRIWTPNERRRYVETHQEANRRCEAEYLHFIAHNRPYDAVPLWNPYITHMCYTQTLTPIRALHSRNIHLRHMMCYNGMKSSYKDTQRIPNFWGEAYA